MSKPVVKVIIEDQVYIFDNLICGGHPIGKGDEPTAFYFGTKDVGELGVNLMYLIRSILKVCRTEFGFPKKVAEELVYECYREALRRELYDRDEQTVTRRVFDQN